MFLASLSFNIKPFNKQSILNGLEFLNKIMSSLSHASSFRGKADQLEADRFGEGILTFNE